MRKIAYICCNCNKAYYSEDDVNQVFRYELNVCKDEFACKGRFLTQKKNIKDFVK